MRRDQTCEQVKPRMKLWTRASVGADVELVRVCASFVVKRGGGVSRGWPRLASSGTKATEGKAHPRRRNNRAAHVTTWASQASAPAAGALSGRPINHIHHASQLQRQLSRAGRPVQSNQVNSTPHASSRFKVALCSYLLRFTEWLPSTISASRIKIASRLRGTVKNRCFPQSWHRMLSSLLW